MFRTLGRTGLKIFPIGFGGIPIQVVEDREAIKVIRRAYELGVNFYDTARVYGSSERKIGEALNDVREEVIIATKTTAKSYENAIKDLETSLSELKTDYIDIWQLHNVSTHETLEKVLSSNGAIEALKEAKKRGKVRCIGITSHNLNVLIKAMETNIFDTIQFPFNYLSDEAKIDVIPKAIEMNLGIIAMKPIAGGEINYPKIALKYVLKHNVTVAIPGMKSIIEVEENVSSIKDGIEITKEEEEIIEYERRNMEKIFCRGCMYCMPCPQGIPISQLLRIKQFVNRTGISRQVIEIYEEAKNTVPNCKLCRQCEEKCPYNLPITTLIHEKLGWIENELKNRG
ncbi:MAG: aldo/keto reductase [Candidatus Methanomethylicia archaeon]